MRSCRPARFTLTACWLLGCFSAAAESFTTNLLDGLYANSGGPYTLGTSGPSNALVILNGGRLDDTTAFVGAAPAAGDNLALILGPQSLWNSAEMLSLGEAGARNQLIITNGGRVESPLAVVGASPSSTNNRAVVAGPGSQWRCLGGFHFGVAGSDNELWVTQGGQILSGGLDALGYSAPSASNKLWIDGAGSSWFSSFQISVGSFGSAGNQCVVSGGGVLAAGYGMIGNGPDNAVLLTDPGTGWFSDGDFQVGYGGQNNRLTITNGARVSCRSGLIAGNTNSVVVTGTGSRWDTALTRAQLVVGERGFGNRLDILGGGQVSSWDGIVSGSNNTVSLRGAGTLWNNLDVLRVGEDFGRTNQITVAEGGEVATGALALAGDYGAVRVQDPGSRLSAVSSLSVGDEVGAGNQLTIERGGRVSTLLGFIGGTDSPFDPHGRNVNNRALVRDPGSIWDNASNLVVGATGSGSQLVVSNGGQVTNASGYLGYYASALQTLAWVSDTNAVWHNHHDLFIGYTSSGNRLVITNGGRIQSTDGFVGRSYNRDNSVLVTGPGSWWNLNRGLVVGNSGYNSQLRIAAGGRVDCAAAYLDAPFDANPGISNSVVVSGTNSMLAIAGALTVGLSSSVNELRIESEGTIRADSLAVGGAATLDNRLTVAGGNLAVTNLAHSGLLSLGRASVTLSGGVVQVDRLVTTPQTAIRFAAGALTVHHRATLAGGQTFTVGTETSAAQLFLGPGNHAFAGGLRVAPGSTFTGAGTLSGHVTNAGTLALGSSLGRLTVEGNFGLADSAVAAFDLGGPAQGGQNDSLWVTNAVHFGGLLRVALVHDYRPASNEVFTLMQFGSATGHFLNAANGARLALEGSDVTARVDYTGTALRLSEFHNANPATNEIDPAWALRYFGHTPLTEEEKQADADGDGLRNADEYWAGTDPLDPGSVLRITSVRREGAGAVALRFLCVPGKNYVVACSTNLVSWTEVGAPVLTTPVPGLCEWLDDGSQTGFPAGASRFYRVGTR